MLNVHRKKMIVVLLMASALALSLVVWHFGSATSREARADDTKLRDLPDVQDSPSAKPASLALPPLASIPWKRDDDRFALVFVISAQVPWLRRADQPDTVALATASLPWLRQSLAAGARSPASLQRSDASPLQPASLPWDPHRSNSYTPVFLETSSVPWRY